MAAARRSATFLAERDFENGDAVASPFGEATFQEVRGGVATNNFDPTKPLFTSAPSNRRIVGRSN
jgi:hypothetical protein